MYLLSFFSKNRLFVVLVPYLCFKKLFFPLSSHPKTRTTVPLKPFLCWIGTVCLHLEVLFHDFSWAPQASADSADKGFHPSSLSLALHKPQNKKNEICKSKAEEELPITLVQKCSQPYSKIATWMIKNIYPDYRDTQRSKKSELSWQGLWELVRNIIPTSCNLWFKIQTKNDEWVQSEKYK